MRVFSVVELRSFFFFFNDTATTEIYTLSLHDALPIYPLPTWSGRKFVRANIEDGQVVQGPLHGITGTRYHTQHRRSFRLSDGGLTTSEREASDRVLHYHRPFKCRQQGSACLNVDEKLGSPDTGNSKESLHIQAAGTTAEEMSSSSEQIDHPGSFFLHSLDGDRCIFVQTENRLVKQSNVSPASFQYPNLITGTELVI